MKTFQTSGRLGDIIYQLYTVKALGGGNILIDLEHHKNPIEKWNKDVAASIAPLLNYQSYIKGVAIKEWGFWPYDVNLVDAENAPKDPEAYPEWRGPNWPGNIHIAKRYAQFFHVRWIPGDVWLEAPKTKMVDVVFHAPMHRTTQAIYLAETIQLLANERIRVAIIDPDRNWEVGNSWGFFPHTSVDIKRFVDEGTIRREIPMDMLEAADWINSAKVFLGAVSSCHAIAEALGKPRLVQQAPDCDNVNSTHVLNGLEPKAIIELIKTYL
mgnify:CR=1 FL=1